MIEFEQNDKRACNPSEVESPLDASQRSDLSIHLPSPAESSFEKNYPKNIFIPIIEYLAEMGLQNEYQKCVGTREKLQGKNVVSLGLIHLLITQPWFIKTVDRKVLLANLSNKIMMNSKIKKKLFHLRVAQVIINLPLMEPKDFKKKVSKDSNNIASECGGMDDQIFSAPNSTIYLLRIFLRGLIQQKYVEYEQQDQNHVGSKQQYKYLVKQISTIINRRPNSNELYEIYQEIKNSIIWREQDLQFKFNLPTGVPNWAIFLACVVDRCFQQKNKQIRITSSAINQWINQFKIKSTTVGSIVAQDKWHGARVFQPIIILPPLLS